MNVWWFPTSKMGLYSVELMMGLCSVFVVKVLQVTSMEPKPHVPVL